MPLRAYLLSLVFVVMPIFAAVTVNHIPPLEMITEHSPPAEFLDETGEVSGVTVDLLSLIMQRLDEQGTFIIMPWSRGLLHAQTHDNVVLFETVRTEKREELFKWVGPLKRYDIHFYARDNRPDRDFSEEHLSRKNIACSYRNSAIVEDIQRLGFSENVNLILTSKSGECIDMLRLGRVDLITLSDLMVDDVIEDLTLQQIAIKPVLYIKESQRYLAFSKDISDERVARWQRALEQSYLDGSMRKLYQNAFSEIIIKRLETFANQHSR